MKSCFRYLALIALVVLTTIAPYTFSSYADSGVPPTKPGEEQAAIAAASLRNPGFDNGNWYWFSYVPGAQDSFVPSYWNIWYKHGTIPFLTRVTGKHVDGDEAVRGHAYWDGSRLKAGVYQVIDGVTPCLTYEFQMHGQSVPGKDYDVLYGLSVGIHPTGDEPSDVAVHSELFDEIVWGTSRSDCVDTWCLLTVTAEARADEVTVFTYADASAGTSNDIVWDAGSFQEIASGQLISDPNDPTGSSGGIKTGPTASVGSTSATINWSTYESSISQVYYRLVSEPSSPVEPGETMSYTVYIPLVGRGPRPWQKSELDNSPDTSHSITLTGLQSKSTYEYFVASRGASGGECVTWISTEKQFTTN